MRNFRHANFGVTHSRWRIPIDRAEITLPVDQHVTHGKGLCHADYGVVDRGIAMWVVFTDDVADYPGGFFVRLVIIVAKHIHRVEHTTVDRFQTITHVGQGAADDDAHGVFEIRLAHLVF